MDIIDRTLQPLDLNDAKGSLLEIQNYLGRVMETIDFTLARHQGQLKEVDPDQVAKLEQSVAQLNQSVISVKNQVTTLGESVSALADRVSAAEELLTSHTAELANHEARITALENRP